MIDEMSAMRPMEGRYQGEDASDFESPQYHLIRFRGSTRRAGFPSLGTWHLAMVHRVYR